jgi:hypothetical protein
MVPLVRFFRGGKTGVLPHGPQLIAIHACMDAAGERIRSRIFIHCMRQFFINTITGIPESVKNFCSSAFFEEDL